MTKFNMASFAMNLVANAFLKMKQDPLLAVSTERARNAQEAVEYFLKLFQKEDIKAKLDKFSSKWIGLMQHRISEISEPLYKGVGKEKACRFLFEHKTKECNDLWITFMKEIDANQKYYDDPLLIQLICDHVFHSIIKLELPEPTMPETLTPTISLEEKNAVCYAAGYVLRSIRLKLSKSESISDQILVSFITTLHDNEENEDNGAPQEAYREWLQKVNHGGLFVIGDALYETFIAIEMVERKYLKDIENPFHITIDLESQIENVITNEDVLFWWALVTAKLENDLADILLKKIVKHWITLRGFSFCKNIVEQYKESNQTSLKRKRSLRKELQQKSLKKNKAE